MRFVTLAVIGGLAVCPIAPAQSPAPPADFAQPQSPTKPTPFPIKYVDQGQFDPKLKGLLAPEGFRVEIVAEDPVVVNPVGLTFAPDGTLFVMEWMVDPVTQGRWFEFKETFRFKDGTTKQVATMKKFVIDPVKVLKFNAAKGVYDKAETIIAEEIPSTLLWHDGWLYTASRGTVRRYKQSRPGGAWDVREIIAQGFCGFHHHQVSGLTIGNEGKLYITSGDDDNFAEGSDGSRATVMRTGAVFRCNPDGSQMETYSLGYRNPYRDLAFDDKFNFFHADNDNEDGSKFTGCRLVHVAEEVDYGWRLKTGARCCRPDFTRGAIAGELPGKLPPMLKTGRGSPAGLLIYHDTKLPEHYRGLQYYPDVFRKLVRAYKVAPKGASFEVTHEFEFLKSDDPLFRPCQMVTGPDGAIYVCDWRTDSGGAGRLSGDGKNGRIYRMKWVGTKESPAIPLRGIDSWATLVKLPTNQLVAKLDAPDFTDRVEARKELVRRGPAARDAVLRQFISGDLKLNGRLVALGVLHAHWSPAVEDLHRLLLNDAAPDVRRVAVEGLALRGKAKDSRNSEAVTQLLTDDHPAVRRTAALALARIGGNGVAESLTKAWLDEKSTDPFLRDALVRSIERLGKPGIDVLAKAARSDHGGSLPGVVAAFTAFRTKEALDTLPDLWNHGYLNDKQRAALVLSYANYQFDRPVELFMLLNYLEERKKEPPVVVAGLEVLAVMGQTDPTTTRWVLAQLDAADGDIRLAALKAVEDLQLAAAGSKLTQALADTKRPNAERVAVLKALRTTAGAGAVKPLIELLNRSEPATLKVEAMRALVAASPDQARTIATKWLDGTDATLLAEAVTVLGATKDGAKLIGERYVAKKLPREMFPRVSDAVKKFNADGSLDKLYGEVMKGSLFLTMTPARAEEIRKLVETKGNPKRGKELYLNTAVLACATCHRMEGVGGSVGPDLTRIWDTQSTEKILETIVEPSKEIKEGYQSYKAVTLDGRVFTGLKVSDTAKEVTLREATGRDVRVPKEDLDDLTPSKVSLMPDNAIAQLTFDQFIDMLAFLKNRPAQESLRGAVLEYAVAVGFKPDLTAKESFEAKPNLSVTGMTWVPRAVDSDGRLNLTPVLPKEPGASYALMYVYSPTRQKVLLNVLSDDPLRVSVAGKVVFDTSAPQIPYPRPIAVQVQTEIPVGWTPVLVKLVSSGTGHKLGLQIAGEGIRTALKPE